MATEYRIRAESKHGDSDDTALNSINLRCAAKGSTNYTRIYSKYAPWGTFSSYKYCSGTNNPVVGFDMRIESYQGNGDDTAANDIDLYCKNRGYISTSNKTTWGNRTQKYSCPSGQAVKVC
mgnify:CR=1 FL=1